MIRTYITAMFLMFSGVVNAAAISSLEITGGSFAMNGGTLDAFVIGDFVNMTVGGYDGSAPTGPDFSTTSIVSFAFGTYGNVSVYTSSTDYVSSGFTPVSGDIANDILTLDLSSWAAWWKGSYNQGHCCPVRNVNK